MLFRPQSTLSSVRALALATLLCCGSLSHAFEVKGGDIQDATGAANQKLGRTWTLSGGSNSIDVMKLAAVGPVFVNYGDVSGAAAQVKVSGSSKELLDAFELVSEGASAQFELRLKKLQSKVKGHVLTEVTLPQGAKVATISTGGASNVVIEDNVFVGGSSNGPSPSNTPAPSSAPSAAPSSAPLPSVAPSAGPSSAPSNDTNKPTATPTGPVSPSTVKPADPLASESKSFSQPGKKRRCKTKTRRNLRDDNAPASGQVQILVGGAGNIYVQTKSAITANSFKTVLSGAGNLYVAADAVEAASTDMEITGAGNICVATTKFSAGKFKLEVGGTGSASFNQGAQCTTASYNLDGIGNIDAGNMACQDAEVSVGGMGKVLVNAKNTLTVQGGGMAEVQYVGTKPQTIKPNDQAAKAAQGASAGCKAEAPPQREAVEVQVGGGNRSD